MKKRIVFIAVLTLIIAGLIATQAMAGNSNKVIVLNKTGKTVSVTLNGQAEYAFDFEPGVSEVYVLGGNYTFGSSGNCGGLSGRINVSRGTVWKFYCKEGLKSIYWHPLPNSTTTTTQEPTATRTPKPTQTPTLTPVPQFVH